MNSIRTSSEIHASIAFAAFLLLSNFWTNECEERKCLCSTRPLQSDVLSIMLHLNVINVPH